MTQTELERMTPEEKLAAIAKACGIQEIWSYALPTKTIRHDVPDYLVDLNAAISLCDFLATKGWNCRLGNGLDKTWECEFMRPVSENTDEDDIGTRNGERLEIRYAPADTLTGAICDAFLLIIK